jgi:hypothetical protein
MSAAVDVQTQDLLIGGHWRAAGDGRTHEKIGSYLHETPRHYPL